MFTNFSDYFFLSETRSFYTKQTIHHLCRHDNQSNTAQAGIESEAPVKMANKIKTEFL